MSTHTLKSQIETNKDYFEKIYRVADKSLDLPGRKQATMTEDIEFHIYPIYNHNWRNISTIYILYITRLASNEVF
jgi:hypothetical protein